ncbi:hypothetical protein vseg_006930 [Gypsophila vaccaria]
MTHKITQQKEEEEEEEGGRWLNLTNDVLALILKRLHTRLDLCRFTSVCKSWRSFAIPKHTHTLFPLTLPPLSPNSRQLSLSPAILYVLSPKDRHSDVWLVKVAEVGGTRWDLLNPLTNAKLYSTDWVKPKRVDMTALRCLELGRAYRVQARGGGGDRFDFEDFNSSISVKKVAVRIVEGEVWVVGLYSYGQIGVWCGSGDHCWKVLEGQFEDVVCFDGEFYAVDRRGRLVRVDTRSCELLELVAAMEGVSMYMYMYNYLVEANYRLYMVNKIVNPRPVNYYDEEEEEWVVDKTSVGKPLGFNVCVLDWRGMCWEKVKSVGNTVLFVSRDATFAVRAQDLGWSKGDCVFFEGLTGYDDGADMKFGLNAGVYSLEDGGISTFGSLSSRWTDIFWPPSSWFDDSGVYSECAMQD